MLCAGHQLESASAADRAADSRIVRSITTTTYTLGLSRSVLQRMAKSPPSQSPHRSPNSRQKCSGNSAINAVTHARDVTRATVTRAVDEWLSGPAAAKDNDPHSAKDHRRRIETTIYRTHTPMPLRCLTSMPLLRSS